MATLAIQEQGARLAVRGRGLAVIVEQEVVRRPRIDRLDAVLIFGKVEISASARALLLRHAVDVTFFDRSGRWRGRLISHESHTAARRMAQYRRLDDPQFALALARRIVTGKLENQRAVLQRLRHNQSLDALIGPIAALRRMIARAPSADSVEALMGIEGHGAAMYYEGLGVAFSNPEFDFSGRNRRPPRDPINACLSFGYAILCSRVESSVRRVGLDPWLGALHAPGRGKPSMALDLMEEWRPMIDRVVLRLINRRQLSPDDFMHPDWRAEELARPELSPDEDDEDDRRAVWLDRSGRAILVSEISRLWRERRQVDALGGSFRVADIIDRQAQAVARCIEQGVVDYEPFSMR